MFQLTMYQQYVAFLAAQMAPLVKDLLPLIVSPFLHAFLCATPLGRRAFDALKLMFAERVPGSEFTQLSSNVPSYEGMTLRVRPGFLNPCELTGSFGSTSSRAHAYN